MEKEYDYPTKIRAIMEELKLAKEKIRVLDEKSKREDKNAMQNQEYMVKIEEKCRDLK